MNDLITLCLQANVVSWVIVLAVTFFLVSGYITFMKLRKYKAEDVAAKFPIWYQTAVLGDIGLGRFWVQTLLPLVLAAVSAASGGALLTVMFSVYALVVIPFFRVTYVLNKDCTLLKTAGITPKF